MKSEGRVNMTESVYLQTVWSPNCISWLVTHRIMYLLFCDLSPYCMFYFSWKQKAKHTYLYHLQAGICLLINLYTYRAVIQWALHNLYFMISLNIHDLVHTLETDNVTLFQQNVKRYLPPSLWKELGGYEMEVWINLSFSPYKIASTFESSSNRLKNS